MKKPSNIILRAALIVAAAGALSFSTSVLAQEDQDQESGSSTSESRTTKDSESTGASSSTTDTSATTSSSPGKKRSTTTKSKAKTSATPAAAAASAQTDEQFLKTAAKGGMMEVHMGQMAQQEGQSAEVKKLGERLVTDHTKANNQLMAIAQKKGLKLDTRHSMDKMSKRDKANFDQAWLAMMLTDHQRDIADFEAEAQNGTDPEVKAFAKKTLPVLQKHLKMVQNAQKKVGTGTTPTSTTSSSSTSAKGTGSSTGSSSTKSGSTGSGTSASPSASPGGR